MISVLRLEVKSPTARELPRLGLLYLLRCLYSCRDDYVLVATSSDFVFKHVLFYDLAVNPN